MTLENSFFYLSLVHEFYRLHEGRVLIKCYITVTQGSFLNIEVLGLRLGQDCFKKLRTGDGWGEITCGHIRS